MPNGLQLVVHHRYVDGMAFDLSDNQNHGAITDAGDNGSSLAFNQPTSRVNVPAGPSLDNPIALCAGVTFRVNSGVSHRQNLIEGHLSFSLNVEPDGSLAAGIVDYFDQWNGGRTGAGVIRPDTWHNAQMMHDGLSRLQLVVDDTVVGTFEGIFGPCRSVGPNGVAIGTWPEPDTRYVLEGEIREAFVAKLDPTPAVAPPNAKSSDPEHYRQPGDDNEVPVDGEDTVATGPVDVDAVAQMAASLVERGVTSAELQKLVDEMGAIGREFLMLLRGGDPDRVPDTAAMEARAMEMLLRGQGPDESLRDQIVDGDPIDAARMADVETRFWKVLEATPIDGEQAIELADALGLGFMVRDRQGALDAYAQVRDRGRS